MKRFVPVSALLLLLLSSLTVSQNITLQPVQGQMTCSVRVPALARQAFALGLPETIGSSEGMILNFPETDIRWEGPDVSGTVRCGWTSSGKVEYELTLTPFGDYVDAEMTIRNISRTDWTNVFSFNCLNPVAAPHFQDWSLERTYMSKNGQPFRMDGTTRINNGSMPTVQFYLHEDYQDVSPFVEGFLATSPDRTDNSYIVTLSDDGSSYMAATSPRSVFLFDNLDRCCIHSAADFGDIPAGEERTVTCRFYFAQGGLQEFLRRFDAEVRGGQAAGDPRVLMCYGNPWALADTTQWRETLGGIDILKFYIGNISTRIDPDSARAFMSALLAHDVKIAVELGGLLDWHASKGDQAAEASFQQDFANVRPLIQLIKSIDPGRSIDMLDMDGPIRRMLFPNNSRADYQTLQSAVDELFQVVQLWRDSIPGIEINLLTNFPNWAWGGTPAYFRIDGHEDGYGQYMDVLDAVRAKSTATGIHLDGLTVDNPFDYAIGAAQSNQPAAIAGVDWMQRLAELQDEARDMGLKVNMIFNTNGGRNAQGYSEQTLALIDLYHDRVGTPDGYWVQSWYQLPGSWLPENQPYTMTNLTREVLRKLDGPQQPADGGYWGLRNIDPQLPGDVYSAFDPQRVAWGFTWDRLENPDDTFNWAYVDNAIDFTADLGAKAVFLITPASSWASGGEARAPDDLDRSVPIDDAVPQRGYSEALYDYVYKIVDRASERKPGVLAWLRYGNEPQYPDHWMTTEQTYPRDVEDYIRCLRTAYLAAHTAAADNGTQIMVSHGGFYYYDQLEREWFAYGETHPAVRDSMLTLFNSHFERQWPKPIDTWDNFRRRQQGRTGMPPTYWMDAIAGQTEWLDWFDIHYHFKPRYIFDDMRAFEQVVLDSGGTLKPWLAAEAAMQLEEAGETTYEERFHAGDMVRKWVSGMAAGLRGICTPIVGAPPDRFFGLYSERGQRYMAADAYVYLRSLVAPTTPPEVLSTPGVAAYRFHEQQAVDVVWLDALFDTDTSHTAVTLPVPAEVGGGRMPAYMQVYDILGTLIEAREVTGRGELAVGQEPRIVLWYDAPQVDSTRAFLEPEDGRVYHGMQTLTFDPEGTDGYLDAMDERTQPAVRGLFFSIPGTRGPALSLRQLAGFYAEADSIGFIPELSLFLTDGEATDSVIAVSTTYDAIIDSIVTLSKAYGRRMFLRIGGEFNGAWNGYHPYLYVDMYRKIVDRFTAAGLRDSIATIWCYMPAAGTDFDSTDARGPLWYPGDEYVDWFGLDVFDVDNFDQSLPDTDRRGYTTKGKSELFLASARAKNKPVYMSETSAIHIDITPDESDGRADWDSWFVKFWEFIAAHPEIKGFSYINALWPENAYPGWGDSRIHMNDYISAMYLQEMHKSKYIHLSYSGTTDVAEPTGRPTGFTLGQSYPNPFPVSSAASTSIPFTLRDQATISLRVYDVMGRAVKSWPAQTLPAGIHHLAWDGRDDAGRPLSAGVYLYRLVTERGMVTRRMVLR